VKYLIFNKILFVAFIIIFIGCKKINNSVEFEDVKHLIIDDISNQATNKTYINSFTFSNDTFIKNMPYSYQEAMRMIQQNIDSIDKTNINQHTKKFLHCLTIANFTQTLFCKQFLGSKIGKSNDYIAIPNWSNLNIAERYQKGNENKVPVWCGDRTSFFISLIDSFLHLKSESISIQNIHTYPIVNIDEKYYIFDPSDLFIARDITSNKILDYQDLRNSQFHNICIYDVKPRFAKFAEFISKRFIEDVRIKFQDNKSNVSTLVCNYLNTESKNLIPTNLVITNRKYPFFGTIKATTNTSNPYVILSDRPIYSLKNHSFNFYRIYFGIATK